jgi:lambda family phage portal protein
MERLIAAIAPGWAARRAQARMVYARLSAMYDGAQQTRRTANWRTSPRGPNAEIQPALSRLRERSRDMVRNNPFASAGLDILVSYQVGSGITPRSVTRDRAVDERVDALFSAWADRADVTGRLDFYGLQALMARSRAEAGEALALLVPLSAAEARRRGLAVPLAIQVVEADHLDESLDRNATGAADMRIRQGVEIDPSGRPAAYHLRLEHPGETLMLGGSAIARTERFAAERVVHLFRQDRPGQIRGVPDMAPVINRLRSLDELEDAALEQAKIQACLAAFVISGAGPAAGPLEGTDPNTGDPLKTFYPGMVERLLPGEDVKFSTPSGPGGFSELARHQLHAIAAGWGLTYDLLTGDLSQANYSSLRAGRLAFKRRLERIQWHVLVPAFQRCWDAFIRAAVVAGELPPLAGGYPVEFAPPVFEMVDPLKDALAIKEMIRMGLLTWGQGVAQVGGDPHRQARDIAMWNDVWDELGVITDVDPRRTAKSGGAQDAAQNAAVEIAATGAATDGLPGRDAQVAADLPHPTPVVINLAVDARPAPAQRGTRTVSVRRDDAGNLVGEIAESEGADA